MLTVGTRRNRKNAVNIAEFLDNDYHKQDTKGKPGRPSKGGQAVRSKRYYINNHMVVLQKRKLKRYHDKVKKLLSEHDYDSIAIMNEFVKKLKRHVKQNWEGINNDFVFYYIIDQFREDRYLHFMNEQAKHHLDTLSQETTEEHIKAIRDTLAQNHLPLVFRLSTLFSAFLLLQCCEPQSIETHYKLSYAHIK
ncbi:uncharacterized protein B0P05DRAFT_30339 [Gilbertella persicaria]|uniref:uncharacterized protein n=1 Tax=Gilbertella persicaria TaxID=101096 RepID=UPI0022211A7D|nr:uncharacterized protein B0P05DRAFT_30339 [Gilbertella persicaria]KAI8084187.1 hypothetical protein B0P05DRAFT_30339 [Gilbertella persicaria]